MRILLPFALSGMLLAQQAVLPPGDPPASAASEKTDISETFKYILVPVTVLNRDSTNVSDLKASDFRLKDNNKLQNINEDVTTHPLSVVIAIQATANMEKLIPQIQKIGSLLQAQVLGEDGEAAILAFDHRITSLTDFSSDTDHLTAALKKLKPGSSSSRLNDAALEGIRLLKSRPDNRRRVLLMIGEKNDKGSELRAREVLTQSEFANVVIYSVNVSSIVANGTASPSAQRSVLDNRPPGAVHLPNGEVETPTTQSQNNMGNWVPLIKEVFTSALDVFKRPPLDIYTLYSGGKGFTYATQRDLEHAVSSIGDELHSQYYLTYLPNNQDEPGFHNIVVQVTRPDLKVRARDGYYLAGSRPSK